MIFLAQNETRMPYAATTRRSSQVNSSTVVDDEPRVKRTAGGRRNVEIQKSRNGRALRSGWVEQFPDSAPSEK